jgi:hypothetical protein
MIGPDGRLGVADRLALLRDGPHAIVAVPRVPRYAAGPLGYRPAVPPRWSPDGSALLVATSTGGRAGYVRYDVAARTSRAVRPDADCHTGCLLVWAADSVRYVLVTAPARPDAEGLRMATLRLVNLDGSLGDTVAAPGLGGLTDVGTAPGTPRVTFSPSGRRAFTYGRWPTGGGIVPYLRIFEVGVGGGGGFARPWPDGEVGWYDDEHLLVVAHQAGDPRRPYEVQVTDQAGKVVRRVLLDGLDLSHTTLRPDVELRPTAGLPEPAGRLGF